MPTQEYKFTFETEQDLFNAERTGYIDAYDCIRMEVRAINSNGSIIDFPVKTQELFTKCLEIYDGNIIKIYPTVHSYDIQDYL